MDDILPRWSSWLFIWGGPRRAYIRLRGQRFCATLPTGPGGVMYNVPVPHVHIAHWQQGLLPYISMPIKFCPGGLPCFI